MEWLVGLYTYWAAGLGVYAIPIAAVDVNAWHAEVRYNYEDVRTGSVWAGPNIEWEGLVPGSITPQGGIVFGNTNGVALGLETEITWDVFTFYAEAEHVVVPSDRSADFTYLWADLSAKVFDVVDIGLTAQRLRSFAAAVETSPGGFIGTSVGIVTPRIYAFSLTSDLPYFMLSIDVEW
ncbi:MAG: hypothetical protein EHM43_03175 [Ignavibacteriae bacterium]|jgi:hypothetical protein|nr:MAG: hypothetical protein EHM43_03175 [Ignavibacteriota bacterium]